jgi:tripartite-type tricarboxylate transporter receptor subunit TctC
VSLATPLPPVSRRHVLCGAGALGLLSVTGLARAEAYPSKPIRIVVGFPPGGSGDMMARFVAERLGSIYSQPVVVENRPGAGATLGAAAVAKSAPDGGTLLLGTVASQAIAPAIYKTLPYRNEADFAPITMLAQVPVALVVHPSLDVRSPRELAALARTAQPPVLFASSGNGAIPHLTAELFKKSQKVPMEHVPYKGAPAAMTDLLAGRVPVMFDHLPSVLPHIKAGRLRGLGIAGSTRARSLPELPTLAEQGIADVDVNSWFGLFAPAGTPPSIVTQLNVDLLQLLNTNAAIQRIADMGAESVTSSPQAFSALIRSDTQKWGRLVRETGATAD